MNTFGRALRFFRPEADRMAVVFLLLLLAIAANLAKPWILAIVVDSLLGQQPLATWLRSAFGPSAKASLLWLLTFGFLGLHLAQAALGTWANYLGMQIGQSGLHRVRNELFSTLQKFSLRMRHGSHSHDLASRAAWDTHAFQSLFHQGFLAPIGATMGLVLMGIVMARLNFVVTLVSFTVVPPLLLVLKHFGSKIPDRTQAAQQAETQVSTFVQQTLASLPLIQSYTREDYEENAFTSRTAVAMEKRMVQHGWELGFRLAVGITFAVVAAAIVWFGSKQVLAGRLTTGQLLIFLAYLPQFFEPLNQLSRLGSTLTHATVGIRRVFDLLDTPEEVKDAPQARPVMSAREFTAATTQPSPGKRGGQPRLPDPRTLICEGTIAFQQVSFAYQKSRPVLEEVSFQITPGQTVAIIGPGGAGKTTLLQLLPRFFDPTAGAILLEGADLRELRLRELRRQIAFVLQEPIVLPASLAENIAYGKPRASRREIEEAARAAHADKFIEKLPNAYNTIIGEGATRLNAGERQRVNLARAFLKDAPLLLLDEPAGAVDAEPDALLVAALANLTAGRTTLIAARRLETIRRADKILVLRDGRLVDAGTPVELASKPGYYSQMLLETQH
ncbi:MAG TPA: ABC transporter ATP-binding protein [Verrucomicrobiae bacterium]|nr:ABC transporter ATP-binding protein [Verrucomicrobiae bacterium]